jgi:hypothetical protein
MKEIVGIGDDGGEWALAVLKKLVSIQQLKEEPHEPLGGASAEVAAST